MGTYLMNEGAFEVAIDGLADTTLHRLESELDGEPVVVLVFRGVLPEGLGLADVAARHRAAEAKRFAGYTEVGEREAEIDGAPALEIAARFRVEGRPVYQREAHVIAPTGAWMVLALRGPYGHREACDGWMDRIISTFRFRESNP